MRKREGESSQKKKKKIAWKRDSGAEPREKDEATGELRERERERERKGEKRRRLTRAYTCARVGARVCMYVYARMRMLRSPARPYVHPSDGEVRANLDVGRRFCFIREFSSSFVQTRASPSSRPRFLSFSLSKKKKKKNGERK
ncbi:hypothetical protein PUN28_016216 [Cardiocondyla obscurior]|uniref:Uncharacterized protein n=1 Tax=Cardiocondyla obscurior TaxID=286306 RepID=A0AAW2ESL7_9HYME